MLAQRRASWHRGLRLMTVVCGLTIAGGFIGCGKSSDPTTATAKSDPTGGTTGKVSPAAPQEQRDVQHPVVQIDTTMGAITIRLDAENAPGTVRNFLNYVNEGFYKNSVFHYVVPGKMILGGGYTAEYEAKPAVSTIRNEAHNGRKNVRGTIAMARDAGLIDSASSQFFINLEDAPQRDYSGESADQYGYCVFGDVIEGLEVAEKISQAPTRDLGAKGADLVQAPQTPVVISGIKVVM